MRVPKGCGGGVKHIRRVSSCFIAAVLLSLLASLPAVAAVAGAAGLAASCSIAAAPFCCCCCCGGLCWDASAAARKYTGGVLCTSLPILRTSGPYGPQTDTLH